MKNGIKLTIMFIAGVALSSVISVFAAIGFVDSKQVSYCPDATNMEATTVSDAIDVLYENVDYLPVGTINAFMGTTVPNKYLLCNGATYNISDYPKLAEHIKKDFGSYNKFGGNGTTTFAVPDLRGEFLRGSGTASRNTGTGAAVGTHQDGSIHTTFGVYGTQISAYYEAAGPQWARNANDWSGDKPTGSSLGVITTAANGSNTQALYVGKPTIYRSRPTNTSVNYIIKAK